MLGAKHVTNPMNSTIRLFANNNNDNRGSDQTLYWSIINAPQYVTFIRLGISFSVNKICQFLT